MLMLVMAAPLHANEMGMNVDDRVKEMKTQLSLTDDQANQVKTIMEDFKTKSEALHKEKQDKLGQVLSADQMTKYKEWKKTWHKKHEKAEKEEHDEN
jgi:Spy/CpxP family protein refolding chaperone